VALARLARNDAVCLFLERARTVAPQFALTAGNAGAVAQICRRLDGLPLAIELAAARTRLLSPAALLARLPRRLPLLTGGPQDAPARQQTLRQTISWSYGLLDARRQALFRRLAVFRGPFGLAAAEAVAGDLGRPVVAEVEALLDESLLLRAREVAGEPQVRMLETVREFARERLAAAGEMTATRRCHAAYLLTLAEAAAAPALEGPHQAAWLDRLTGVHDDLRAALGWLAAHGEGERALRLGVALWPFWRTRGHRAEAGAWYRRLLARHGGAAPAALRAAALACAGDLAVLQSVVGAAQALMEQSVVLGTQWPPPAGAAALFRLAMLARSQGDLRRAQAAAAESLHLARASDDDARAAWALGLLATVRGLQGELDAAGALLAETVARYQELGDPTGLAWTRFAQGQIALQLEDGLQAAGHFGPALAAFRTVRDAGGIAAALLGLGQAARLQSDFARAGRLLRQSARRFRQLGEQHNLAPALAALGRVNQGLDDTATARDRYLESLAVAQRLDVAPAAAPALEGLAALDAAEGATRGQAGEAVRLLAAVHAIRPETGGAMPTSVLGRRERAACIDGLRARLGPPAFAAAWRLAPGAPDAPGGGHRPGPAGSLGAGGRGAPGRPNHAACRDAHRGAQRPRARSGRPDRPRADQPPAWRAPFHHRRDGGNPCAAHPEQAGIEQTLTDRRLGGGTGASLPGAPGAGLTRSAMSSAKPASRRCG
jgi:tetratricopeptide (TPR) repeat protein